MARKKFSDIKDVEPGSFAPLPVGDYVAQVVDVKKLDTQKGNKMVNLTFSVLEGECAGRKFFDNMVYLENCDWKFKATFKALGFQEVGGMEIDFDEGGVYFGDGSAVKKDDIIGKKCLASLEIDTSGSKARNNVAWLKPLTEEEAAPVDEVPAQTAEKIVEEANNSSADFIGFKLWTGDGFSGSVLLEQHASRAGN